MLRLVGLRADLEGRREELAGACRGAQGVARPAHRDPGRRATAVGARHPRRRPAAPGGARGQPAAGADRREALADARRGRARRAGRRGRGRDRDPTLAVARHLPAPAVRRRAGAGPRSPPWRPARSRSPSAPSPWYGCPRAIEAALYFCCMEAVQNAAKHSGAGADRGSAETPTTERLHARRDRRRYRLRRPSSDEASRVPAWSTCATGSTRSAARSPLPRRRAAARRSPPWSPWSLRDRVRRAADAVLRRAA